MPGFVAFLGFTTLGAVGIGAASAGIIMATGATVLGFITYSAIRGARLRNAGDGGASAANQQVLVRSTTEPRKIVYGQAVVSGPIVFMNTANGATPNGKLYIVVAIAGHAIDSYLGFYLDDKYIPVADIDTGGDGSVDTNTGGHGFIPVGASPTLYLRSYLGTASQTVDSDLDSAFDDWTSDHRGRGVAYFIAVLDRVAGDATWETGPPRNITALVKGKKIYDPRLDSTFTGTWGTGSGAHRVNDPTTWAWSANSALCLADYLIDTDLGAAFPTARVNYNSVAIAADACATTVAIPTSSSEVRFSCNGVLSCLDDHRENIEKILSSMGGTIRYLAGQWHISASVWPSSSSFALTESDLVGDVSWQPSPDRSDRYNAVRGLYFDPSREYKETAYLQVEDTSLQSARDDNLVLWKDLDLPLTNSEYMAQRIAMRMLEQASRPGILVFPMGYRGMDIAPGDRGTVTIAELGFNAKTFRCIGIRHVDMVGVELVLREDDSGAYSDPAEGEYGTRSAASVIEFPQFVRDVQERPINDDFVYLSAAELRRRWTDHSGTLPDNEISLVTGLTDVPGGTAVRFGNNSGTDVWVGTLADVLMPYDATSTYEAGIVVKRGAGTGTVYFGVQGVANDRVTLINTSGSNSYTNPHWIAANGVGPAAFTTYRGYIRGYGTSFSFPNNDPSVPSPAYTGVTFIRPTLTVNSGAAGQTDVAAIWLKRLPTVGTPNIGVNAAEVLVSSQPSDGTEVIGTISYSGGGTLVTEQTITDVSWTNDTGESIDVVLRQSARVQLSASDSLIGRKLAIRWSLNGGSSWSYDGTNTDNINITAADWQPKSTQRSVTVADGETIDLESIVVLVIPDPTSGDPADVQYRGLSLSIEAKLR